MTLEPTSTPFDATKAIDLGTLQNALLRSRFAGDDLRGNLPAFPSRPSLTPLAAAAPRRARVVFVPGAAGVADALWLCLKTAADTYVWVQLDNISTATIQALINATALGGELAGTVASGTVAATHSGSKHSLILRASNTAEVTTTSTSAVDLLSFASLSIPATSGIIIEGVGRKSNGAAAYVGIGLKLNATVVCEANSAGTAAQIASASNTNQNETFMFRIEFGPRATNYFRTGMVTFASFFGGGGFLTQNGNAQNNAAAPTDTTITDIAIRAISGNALVTAAVKEVAVYEVLYS